MTAQDALQQRASQPWPPGHPPQPPRQQALTLETAFSRLAKRGERALIGYLTAMDPDPDRSLHLMAGAVAAGVDILEVGLPAAAPHLDGAIIRAAHARVRAGCGGSLPHFDSLAAFLQRLLAAVSVPVLLMGYAGEWQGGEGILDLLDRLPSGRVVGLVLPDLPPERADGLQARLSARGAELVRFVDPTMHVADLPGAVAGAEGLLYAMTYRGTTGQPQSLPVGALTALRSAIGALRPELRVVAGFGIATPADVLTVCRAGYDGAVVGSALVGQVGAGNAAGLFELVRALKDATREG